MFGFRSRKLHVFSSVLVGFIKRYELECLLSTTEMLTQINYLKSKYTNT